MKLRIVLMGLLALALVLFHIETVSAQDEAFAGRTITGTIYFVGGRRPARSTQFKLNIDRFSSPQEESQLNTALQRGGQDELLSTLHKMKAGRITIGTGVGIDANAIFGSTGEDGRTKITVLYERKLGFGELRYGARSTNYRFGYAELYVGRGTGEGMLIPAAIVRLKNGDTWEVEDFGTFPARLMGLQVRGRGKSNIQ